MAEKRKPARPKQADPDVSKEKEEVTVEQEDATKEWHYVPYGVTTFAEFDMHSQAREIREKVLDVSSVFQQLVENVLYDSDVKDKEGALTSLVTEFANRCKAVAKENHSKEVESTETPTTPATATETEVEQPKVEDRSNFFVFKETSGRLRWFAVYSNNFLDDDGKPEIISEKSHETFAYLVKENLVPYPELWHWHIPGTKWGVADYVDYANGMAYATGLVDEGHEKEATALEGIDILVSHGMPGPFVVYNPDNPSIIDFHITREISPLPTVKAANKFTGFVTL